MCRKSDQHGCTNAGQKLLQERLLLPGFFPFHGLQKVSQVRIHSEAQEANQPRQANGGARNTGTNGLHTIAPFLCSLDKRDEMSRYIARS